MKKLKIWYWVTTILIAAYMLFTAVPNIMVDKGSTDLITGYLGFPTYMIPFLGVAKVLGSITILIPGLNRLKEWAYAGLFFDLTGATYALTYKTGLTIDIIWMILPIVVLFISYYLWHRIKG